MTLCLCIFQFGYDVSRATFNCHCESLVGEEDDDHEQLKTAVRLAMEHSGK